MAFNLSTEELTINFGRAQTVTEKVEMLWTFIELRDKSERVFEGLTPLALAAEWGANDLIIKLLKNFDVDSWVECEVFICYIFDYQGWDNRSGARNHQRNRSRATRKRLHVFFQERRRPENS